MIPPLFGLVKLAPTIGSQNLTPMRTYQAITEDSRSLASTRTYQAITFLSMLE